MEAFKRITYNGKQIVLSDYGELGLKIWNYIQKFENNGHIYTDEDRVYAYKLIQLVCDYENKHIPNDVKIVLIEEIIHEVDSLST